ncbi:MAG: hypothetical protein ABI345_03835 [Jatrophihabitans sp.]
MAGFALAFPPTVEAVIDAWLAAEGEAEAEADAVVGAALVPAPVEERFGAGDVELVPPLPEVQAANVMRPARPAAAAIERPRLRAC